MKKHMEAARKNDADTNHSFAKTLLALVGISNLAFAILRSWPQIDLRIIFTQVVFGWFLYKGKAWARILFASSGVLFFLMLILPGWGFQGVRFTGILTAGIIFTMAVLFGFKQVNAYFNANKRKRVKKQYH